MLIELLIRITVNILGIMDGQVNATLKYDNIILCGEISNLGVDKKCNGHHEENITREISEIPIAAVTLIHLQLQVNSQHDIHRVCPGS